MSTMEKPHPLSWPAGWPKTPIHLRKRAQFSKKVHNGKYMVTRELTVRDAEKRLQGELDRLGAIDELLSSNMPRNLDGSIKASASALEDCGVAIYFQLDGQPTALACDKWDRVADNICALAKHIEALRGMDRWGVGSVKQAFAGYQALPAPEQWFEVLGVSANASIEEINTAYRSKAKHAHSDQGGSDAAMSRLNVARDQGLAVRS